MVTMSQKSSFLQPANSVSQVLIPDRSAFGRLWMYLAASPRLTSCSPLGNGIGSSNLRFHPGSAATAPPSSGAQCRQPFLSESTLNPVGVSGGSAALQSGHGAPAPPQSQARGPCHGRSGWFSQTQRSPSQRGQVIGEPNQPRSCRRLVFFVGTTGDNLALGIGVKASPRRPSSRTRISGAGREVRSARILLGNPVYRQQTFWNLVRLLLPFAERKDIR